MTPVKERDVNRIMKETNNRPDEWKIEQGMAASKLPIIDQTGKEVIFIHPGEPRSIPKNTEAIELVGDRNRAFSREIAGWKGYEYSQITGV
jgi:sulfite oxidase